MRRLGTERRRNLKRRISGPAVVLLTVLVAFCTALVLWTRGGPDTSALPPLTTSTLRSIGPPQPDGSGSATSSGATSPGGTPSNGGTDLGSGLSVPALPPNQIKTFAPGPHSVEVTAVSSSGRIGAVSYFFGHKSASAAVYNVRAPFRVSAHVSGQDHLAAIGVQVVAGGGTATCSVIVDGSTVVRQTASGAGHVAVCGV